MAKNGKSRPGRNPSVREAQLKGMLVALDSTAKQLDNTNKVLTAEASAVLETLWNGHQEIIVILKDLTFRVEALENPAE